MIVEATYDLKAQFTVPAWIDLNDKTQVVEWQVMWNVLYIHLVKSDKFVRVQPDEKRHPNTQYPSSAVILPPT